MNYFFIHTPIQLIVAQGIIKLNDLKQNIVFFGHTGTNAEKQYLVIQDILIEPLWQQVYQIGDLHNYVPSLSHPSSFFKVNRALNGLNNIIEKNKTTHLFFGDLNAIAYIIMIKHFKVKKISFFEEGISHYNLGILQPKTNANVLKGFAYNFLSKYLISVNSISQYIFNKEPSSFDFEIYKRYNILNRTKSESFDERLDLKAVLKKGVNTKFVEPFKAFKESGTPVIFLSSTIRNIFDDGVETDVIIIEKISKLFPSDSIFIKFHPKDDIVLNKKVINIINERGINASELNIPSEVPMEILFDVIEPKALFGYGSSSQLYFSQFSKSTPNTHVLELLDKGYIKKQQCGPRLLSIINNWEKLKKIYL
jgi:hypothetical protein